MKRDYTTWEEEFGSDISTFHDEDDEAVGFVRPCAGSWEAIYRGTTVAICPSKELALKAIIDTHRESA